MSHIGAIIGRRQTPRFETVAYRLSMLKRADVPRAVERRRGAVGRRKKTTWCHHRGAVRLFRWRYSSDKITKRGWAYSIQPS
jgi:hypothetical protein